MQGILIFLCSSIFMCGTYLVWPSRYNVMAHLNVGFILIAYFIPAIILQDQNEFSADIVSLYVRILVLGAIFFVIGLYSGFSIKPVRLANFSFIYLDKELYKKRIIKITRILLITGVIGMAFGYLLMGFVPAFAADPVAAKFFRGPYQVPFYVSIVYLSSFFILTTITPIAIVIWFTNKKKNLFLIGTITAVTLMICSLSRGPAFGGVVLAVAIIMSFKNRKTFILLIVVLISVYVFSSVFYFIIGVRNLTEVSSSFKDDHDFLRIISAGTIDIQDQLNFLRLFNPNPIWTYGRTVLGGLVPSHYEWNPSVYTLKIVNSGQDINTIISGGLRLQTPMWGYVSFQWVGVATFCLISGFLKGLLLKFTKYWIYKSQSLLIATVIIVINISIFAQVSDFFTLSIYALPPTVVLIFYAFRVRME